MDKGKHIYLQDIDLKDNSLLNASSVSRGNNKISFGDSDITLQSESITFKNSEDGDMLNLSESGLSIATENFDFNGNVSLKADEDSLIEVTDNSIDINSPKVSIQDPKGLQILSEDEDGSSHIKSDISESDTSKVKEIVIDDTVKIIVSEGSLCFVKKG